MDLVEGDLLLNVFSPKSQEKQAVLVGPMIPGSSFNSLKPPTPPVVPQSWIQRNSGPVALGGMSLAGILGGGALAHYKNEQDKKKRKELENQQNTTQIPEAHQALKEKKPREKEASLPTKQASPPAPLPEPQLFQPSTWKIGDRVGNAAQNLGNRFGSGVNQSGANPLHSAGEYVKNNPWASMALVGAPIGAGIGLLGGLSNRKKKRDSLGDMLTGGLLGAGAGALGGGAYQMLQGNKQEPPAPKPDNVVDTPGASPNSPFGEGKAEVPYEKAKNWLTGNHQSHTAEQKLLDANQKIDFSASRVSPDNPRGKVVQDAANDRAANQNAVFNAQSDVPTRLERLFGLGSGEQAFADQAARGFQDSTKRLALQMNKLTPNDFTAIPGTPNADGTRPNIATPVAGVMGGLGLGAQNTLDFKQHDANMRDQGLTGRLRMSETPQGRTPEDVASGIDNYAPQEMQPSADKAIVDPELLNAYAQNQTPQIPDPFGEGSLASNTAKNTGLIAGARWLGNRALYNTGPLGNNAVTRSLFGPGGDTNATAVARMAQGLQKSMAAPATPPVKPGKGRFLLNPMKLVDGIKDLTGRAGRALRLTTKPVTPEQFAANPGAVAALSTAHNAGMGNPSGGGKGVISPSQITPETLRKGGLTQAISDLAKGEKQGPGLEKILLGAKTQDLAQWANNAPVVAKITSAANAAGGKVTSAEVHDMLSGKIPMSTAVQRAVQGADSVFGASKVTGTNLKLPGVGGGLGRQLTAGAQNLGLGAVLAAGNKALVGGQNASALGAQAFGKDNDPTDPKNIARMYDKVTGGGVIDDGGQLPKSKSIRAGINDKRTYNEKGEETFTAAQYLRRLLGYND